MNDLEFNKQGTNWNDKIMPKQIFEQTYDIGHFLLNHSHPIIEQLKLIVFATYKVKMKFIDGGYNNEAIWCNSRWLCMRQKKTLPVIFNNGVTLIEGTPSTSGGSNKYPRVYFKEGYCILEFTSNGLPMTNYLSGWKSEILELNPINK